MVSFAVKKTFQFSQVSFIFGFIFIILGGGSEKIVLLLTSDSVLPIFSSKSFMVSSFIFRSLINFEFIFCMVLENILISFFYM